MGRTVSFQSYWVVKRLELDIWLNLRDKFVAFRVAAEGSGYAHIFKRTILLLLYWKRQVNGDRADWNNNTSFS